MSDDLSPNPYPDTVLDNAEPIELWRVEYKPDAYTDQFGMKHWAYVVYDQRMVTPVATTAQYEYYGKRWYKDTGVIAFDDEDREYFYSANLVDYTGGGSWSCLDEENSYWKAANKCERSFTPHVTPDGESVTRLEKK